MCSTKHTMGQYYKYYNASTDQISTIGYSSDPNIMWVCKLYYYSEEDIRSMFESQITLNRWNKDDDIFAMGDYGNKIFWSDYQQQ